jgi:hypothetical protein
LRRERKAPLSRARTATLGGKPLLRVTRGQGLDAARDHGHTMGILKTRPRRRRAVGFRGGPARRGGFGDWIWRIGMRGLARGARRRLASLNGEGVRRARRVPRPREGRAPAPCPEYWARPCAGNPRRGRSRRRLAIAKTRRHLIAPRGILERSAATPRPVLCAQTRGSRNGQYSSMRSSLCGAELSGVRATRHGAIH